MKSFASLMLSSWLAVRVIPLYFLAFVVDFGLTVNITMFVFSTVFSDGSSFIPKTYALESDCNCILSFSFQKKQIYVNQPPNYSFPFICINMIFNVLHEIFYSFANSLIVLRLLVLKFWMETFHNIF